MKNRFVASNYYDEIGDLCIGTLWPLGSKGMVFCFTFTHWRWM